MRAPHGLGSNSGIGRVVAPDQMDAKAHHVFLADIHGRECGEDDAQRLRGLRADIVAPMAPSASTASWTPAKTSVLAR